MSVQLTSADLRAAVQAGYLTEIQASQVQALAAQRLAGRPAPDDEPFEMFRGFSEIFISVGLAILMTGLLGVSALMGSPLTVAGVCVVLSAVLAQYFTIQRRMVLPSIVLVCAYGAAAGALILWFAFSALLNHMGLHSITVIALVLIMAALVLWYGVFRLPFTMLLIGLSGVVLAIALIAPSDIYDFMSGVDMARVLSLTSGSGVGVATLGAGLVLAAVALRFDMRDPYRLGRASASAFWLALVAAPAIVNALGQTAMAMEGGARLLAMGMVLLVMAFYALVIDRRSFLTAGLGYLAWLIWALGHRDGNGLDWPVILILIGGAVTALGAWWVPLRAALMRALPQFPGKTRLPPYAKGDL